MNKLLITLLFVVVNSCNNAISAIASEQAEPRSTHLCQEMSPYNLPQLTNPNSVSICRKAYIILEDLYAKIPIWVVYTLTPEHALGCLIRINSFTPDLSLPKGQRSELADYAHSGYDTGHMANDADMNWDPTAQAESFILSNMTPQTALLNRGSWKVLETAVRSWVFNTNHSLTIYAGSIYEIATDKKIGPNSVTVPHAFYKIVIDNTIKQTLAFIFYQDSVGKDLTKFQVSVTDVEKETGITFFVPDDKKIKHIVWPIDVKERAQAKKSVCSIK